MVSQRCKVSKLLKKEDTLTHDSYYEASAVRPPAWQRLLGRKAADICVVGGGYAVALLEAQQLGWGASGRNGGQVIVGYGFGGEDTLEAQLPADDVLRAWNISMEGLQLVQDRITAHQIDCDYVPGYLSLAVNARKARVLAARVEHMARVYGYPMQHIAAQDIGQWIASNRFHAGAFDPQSGHLHPLKYCLGLAAAARAAGVRIFEHSAVHHIERGAKPVVATKAANWCVILSCWPATCISMNTAIQSGRSCHRASCRLAPTSLPPTPWPPSGPTA